MSCVHNLNQVRVTLTTLAERSTGWGLRRLVAVILQVGVSTPLFEPIVTGYKGGRPYLKHAECIRCRTTESLVIFLRAEAGKSNA